MDDMFNGEGHTGETYPDVNYTSGIDMSNIYYVPSQGEGSMQEALPSQPRKKPGHKRTKNFTPIEDETICFAYLNVSKDPIVGVNQTMQCYSARITEFYNENKKSANPRTASSLQHRWSDIQKETSRFCGFYAEIERRNQSEKSEDDKIKDALQLFSGLIESLYRFLHCWFILRHEYKWNSYLASLSTPNAENADKTAEGSKDDTLPSRIPRPMGRDKAKKLRSSSASNSSACLEVLQKMQSDRQIYEQRVEEATSAAESAIACRAERKLAIQEENLRVQQMMQDKTSGADLANAVRAERKLAIQEEQLRVQQRILAIEEEQQENLVMSMDLDKMTPWVREFYMSKQKELAAKREMRDSSTT